MGAPVKVYMLSGKVVKGTYVGSVDKFIILKDGEVDNTSAKYLAIHKNQIKYFYVANASLEEVEPIDNLETVFKQKVVRVLMLKKESFTGDYLGQEDRYLYFANVKGLEGELEEILVLCVHKNQIELLYTEPGRVMVEYEQGQQG